MFFDIIVKICFSLATKKIVPLNIDILLQIYYNMYTVLFSVNEQGLGYAVLGKRKDEVTMSQKKTSRQIWLNLSSEVSSIIRWIHLVFTAIVIIFGFLALLGYVSAANKMDSFELKFCESTWNIVSMTNPKDFFFVLLTVIIPSAILLPIIADIVVLTLFIIINLFTEQVDHEGISEIAERVSDGIVEIIGKIVDIILNSVKSILNYISLVPNFISSMLQLLWNADDDD